MPSADRVAQVVAQLEEMILTSRLAPGDMLPSEREISAQMGVARSVVREALGRLSSLGLVRSQHGLGTRVEQPSGRQVRVGYQRLLTRSDVRLADLAAVRLPLETTIAGLAARTRTDEHLARLRQTQLVLGDETRTLEERARADLEFHSTLADATGNPLFRVVLEPMQEILIESRRRTLGRYGSPLAHEHHAAILAAIEAGDEHEAREAMRRHIDANFEHLANEQATLPEK